MNEEKDKINWDSYFIPGTNVLVNKLGILDATELRQKEIEMVEYKLTKLYLEPINGSFDSDHLVKIHEYLFSDIYPFAGKYRTCTMQKQTMFCSPKQIPEALETLLKKMNDEFDNNTFSHQEFAFKLGSYYYNLIYVHPFREGNGRSIRCFLRDFIVSKSNGSLDIDYNKMDAKNLMLGTVNRYIYPSLIEMEFFKGIIPTQINKSK